MTTWVEWNGCEEEGCIDAESDCSTAQQSVRAFKDGVETWQTWLLNEIPQVEACAAQDGVTDQDDFNTCIENAKGAKGQGDYNLDEGSDLYTEARGHQSDGNAACNGGNHSTAQTRWGEGTVDFDECQKSGGYLDSAQGAYDAAIGQVEAAKGYLECTDPEGCGLNEPPDGWEDE